MPTSSWKITNSTSSKKQNLVLIDAYTDQVLATKFFYEQTLALINASSSQPYVKPGGYETFAIPPVHTDTNGTSLPYTFIIATAETLKPVKVVEVKSNLSDLADLEITDDTVIYMDTVFDFIQNITAFPTSDLAVDFAAALNSDNDDTIRNFFANTLGYKDIKVEDVHLVQSYYKALPYGWVEGKDVEFYLYSSDYQNNTNSDEPVAKLSITNDWTKQLPVTVDTSLFKIELTTTDDKATKTLVFKDGVFWDSITTDTHKIALAGSFIMPSELTKSNSRNSIEAYLQGTLNNYDVFGLNGMAPHDQDGDGGFLDLFDVHTFKEGLDLAMYFITIGMGIAFLVSCYAGAKYLKNKFKSDDDLDRQKKLDEMKEFIRQNNEALAQQLNPRINVPQPAQIRQNQGQAREQLLDMKTRAAKVNMQKMVDAQRAGFDAISSKYVNNDTAIAMDNLQEIQTRIDTNTLADIRGTLEDTMTRFNANNMTLVNGEATVNARLSEANRQAYERSRNTYDEALEQQRTNAEEVREIEQGEDEIEVEN